MMIRSAVTVAILSATVAGQAAAQERYFEKDGVTYRETRRVVQRPVVETRIEEREKTVYVERLETELQDSYRVVQVPVTEYRWETHMRNRWNPFASPSLEWRYVPRTRWETRYEPSAVPVTRRTVVPEKRIQQIPVAERKMVEEEIISRVAVSPNSSSSDPFDNTTPRILSRRPDIGGISRLDNDPPRYGAPRKWRASDTTTLR